MNNLIIRKGEKRDLPATLDLIKELAVYEKEPDAVVVDLESMERDGFGSNKVFDFFVAELDNEIYGIAVYYFKYSTWKGTCLYLEDIVVSESKRSLGIGSRLFESVVDVAKSRKCRRMEWQVLEWNEPAIAFYKKHKAIFDHEWINVKFEWDHQ
jgi:GNAT superfamily N-acetyltransferase